MKFCPNCQRSLSLKIRTDSNSKQYPEYVCGSCNYRNKLDSKTDKCIMKNEYDLQTFYIQDKKNLKFICQDPTVPHINNIPCPDKNCVSHKNEDDEEVIDTEIKKVNRNLVAYTKIDDNDMKFRYICCHCYTSWTNN